MQERNLKVIEGLLFVLFILLWGLFLSGGSGKVTLSLINGAGPGSAPQPALTTSPRSRM